MLLTHEDRWRRELRWSPLTANAEWQLPGVPAGAEYSEAVTYLDQRKDLLYGQLVRVAGLVWRQDDDRWRYRMTVVVRGHGHDLGALSPLGPEQANQLSAVSQVVYTIDDFMQFPMSEGLEWLHDAPEPLAQQVRLSPGAQQAMAWLRRHVGGTDDEMISGAVELYQNLEQLHRRGKQVYIKQPTSCGHDEYRSYMYLVGQPRRPAEGGTDGGA